MTTKRSSNFSKLEEERLVQLVLAKKNIFENKKTDAITSKKKDEAWAKLADEFNASNDHEVNYLTLLQRFLIRFHLVSISQRAEEKIFKLETEPQEKKSRRKEGNF